jgi:hypothetical protein
MYEISDRNGFHGGIKIPEINEMNAKTKLEFTPNNLQYSEKKSLSNSNRNIHPAI